MPSLPQLCSGSPGAAVNTRGRGYVPVTLPSSGCWAWSSPWAFICQPLTLVALRPHGASESLYKLPAEATLRDISSLLPDHDNKLSLTTKQVKSFSWWKVLPSICRKRNTCEGQESQAQWKVCLSVDTTPGDAVARAPPVILICHHGWEPLSGNGHLSLMPLRF